MPIRITVEVVPHGREDASQIVGSAYIENDGTDLSHETGNYSATFFGGRAMCGAMDRRIAGRSDGVHSARLCGFPRSRLGVWSLLKRALANFEEGA